MKFIMSVIFLALSISNCTNKEYRFIEADRGTDLEERRLGQTDYYVKLSNSFELNETHGKEGQKGFDIVPKDTSSTMFGFIEIDLGQRLGDDKGDWGTLKEKVQCKLLNRQAVWKIYQTETGHYVAVTSIRKIYSEVSSKKKNEIDSLISIVATLGKN